MKKIVEKSKNDSKPLTPEVKDFMRFVMLYEKLSKHSFKDISGWTSEQYLNVFRYARLKNKKIAKQFENQVIFLRFVNDYFIIVLTSFNPELGENGKFSIKCGSGRIIVINKKGEESSFRRFNRVLMDNFINNLFNEACFLLYTFKNRPKVKGTELYYDLKQTDLETVWVNPENETDTRALYLGEVNLDPKLSIELKHHSDVLKYRTQYYRNGVSLKKDNSVLIKIS